ncbi:MAG: 50S ribosomal protein L4 [Dehalococcoidia bacterium]|nr:50S ribosomal protein L4 [Dehalococcoidia bacterium]
MEIELKNIEGKVIKKIPASDYVWAQPMNESLVHQVVVAQRNNRRQGTSSSMRRRDSDYSTAKLRAQKGSGRARVGSRSSHLFGNSVAHGPRPRSFSQKIQRRVKKASIRMVLSEKLKEGEVTLLDNFAMDQISSKRISQAVKNIGLLGKSLLIMEKSEIERNLLISIKNVKGIKTVSSDLINTYDLMAVKNLLITQEALSSIEKIWDRKGKAGGNNEY